MGISTPTPSPPSISLPPPTAHPSTFGSASVIEAGNLETQRSNAAQGKGFNNTVGTSMQGAPAPQTAKTMLG